MKRLKITLMMLTSVIIMSCSGPGKESEKISDQKDKNDMEQNTEDKHSLKPEPFSYEGHDFYLLPYDYNALEPAIDELTVETHYSKHHKSYFTKYIDAVKGTDLENKSLEEILAEISKYPLNLKKNLGQYYNHIIYWKVLSPNGGGVPQEPLNKAIADEYGSFEEFKEAFNNASLSIFGSGWAWLAVDKNGKLFISTTSNDENPLMDIAEKQGTPLLAVDVWEHAYYLKYQNKRNDYLNAIWNIIDWDDVNTHYKDLMN